MSDPALDTIVNTNATVDYENCDEAHETLGEIQWEPDGRNLEVPVIDLVPFSIEIVL